ncbi:MAG: NADAR family protein, partial [Verrucomicrobia bacterium]|nr:NADAR family protein [Verrucomicrobiota bacterium]
ELQELVRRVATAEQTRELGNSPCLPRRGDWATVREAVMQRALRAKFEQHPLLAEQLAATGHAELIYDAPEDAYWGAGPDRCGRNRLGVLLMRLRAELAASPARAVLQAA